MTVKVREELVGKRFVSLREGSWAERSSSRGSSSAAAAAGTGASPSSTDLDWRRGVIRAVASSPPYQHDHGITVLVEYDGIDWHDRCWVAICQIFEVFLIEESVVWVPQKFVQQSESSEKLFPALTFRALIDKIGLNSEMITKPVEFLGDKRLEFIDRNLSLQAFEEVDLKSNIPICDDPLAMERARQWLEFQSGQQILLQTPSVLVGYRVQVYRSEGTTQWYTAVIKSYSERSQQSPLKASKQKSYAKRRNFCVTSKQITVDSGSAVRKEQVKPYSENCTVDCRKGKSLNGTLLSLTSQKLLKQSNSTSYSIKCCDRNVSAKSNYKTPQKLLEFDKTFQKRNSTAKAALSDLSVKCVDKCSKRTSNNKSQDNSVKNSCGSLEAFEQKKLERVHNKSRNNTGITKGCSSIVLQTGQCSLLGSNDVLQRLNDCITSADCHSNSSEILEATKQLKPLKSVVSAHHTTSLLHRKTDANPSSSAMECLNLSGKTQEVRRQLLPVVKTNETGETDFSGLNLNQSVTDQITQRSREKITKTLTSNEAKTTSNAAAVCAPTTTAGIERLQQPENMKGIRGFRSSASSQDFAPILNNSPLQQQNFVLTNNLNCQSESNQNIAKNLVNSKPVSISHVNENQPRSGGSEINTGVESLVSKFSSTLDETTTRKNIELSALPYALPLFSQAPATTTVPHQLPAASLVNHAYPLSQLLLQNQIALQMEQWRFIEKQLQLSTSAGSFGAILAAYPQYMANAISPEVFWMHYQERLREVMLLQRQQQLPSHASESGNGDSKAVPAGTDKALKNVSSSTAAENLKKEVLSTNTLPQNILDSRIREPTKESVIERCKDVGHNQMKRSELIVHGTVKVNDAVDQHFTESLRLAGQKPSSVTFLSGGNHRNSFAHSGVSASTVCQEQDPLTRPRTGLAIGPTESSSMKEGGQKQRIDNISTALTPMPISSLSTSLHLPSAVTPVSPAASVQAAGILSSSVSCTSSSFASIASGNVAKMEPNFNLYGYQPCAIYIPQTAIDMQGLKEDKRAAVDEQESRKNSSEKFSSMTGDVCRQLSSVLPVRDNDGLKNMVDSKSLLLAGLGQRTHSPQMLKNEATNTSKTKNVGLSDKYLPLSSADVAGTEGSINYVVTASASKGHPVFIPVLPILSNGQAPIVKMPTLKDCLSSKTPTNKNVLGLEVIAGNTIRNGHAVGAPSSVVTVPDRTPNGMLTSLPISSAAAVYSFSLSQSQGLHLLQNSVLQTVSSASRSISSSVVSLTSASGSYSHTASKRNHKIMTNEINGLLNDVHLIDVKKLKTDAADSVRPGTNAGISSAATLVPNSLCASTVAMCSPNSTKMHLTYSDCFRSFVETTNCVGKSHVAAENQLFPTGSALGDREHLTVIVSREGLAEDKCQVLDLKLPSEGSTSRIQDNGSCADASRGADSDTLSAYSPGAPVSALPSSLSTGKPIRSDPVTQKQWHHTKFKKAMLQRYSDEDKNNASQDAEIKRAIVYGAVSTEDKEDTGSCGGTNNDATSVASEQDSYEWSSATDSKNSKSIRKKRKSNRISKSEPPDKTLKSSSEDTDESTTSSLSAVKLTQVKKAKMQQNKDESNDEMASCQKAVTTEESNKPMLKSRLFLDSLEFQLADCQWKIMKRQEELKHSKCRDDPSFILANKALNSNSEEHNQQTMEVFLQDGACRDVTPRLVKCRECKLTRSKKDKRVPNDFCRFYAFRRLRYSPKRFLTTAGFSEPGDADALDIELWMPLTPVMAPSVDTDTARYMVSYIGNRFISLVEQEQEAISWCPANTKMAWKRAVQGVREMCDVCDATLFNVHWVCEKCGFAVCIDCFRLRSFAREKEHCRDEDCRLCEHHKRKWLTCSANRQAHETNQLTMAQIIPSDVLWVVRNMLTQIQGHFFYDSKVKSEDVSLRDAPVLDALKETGTKELPYVIKCEKNSQSLLPSSFSDLKLLADGLRNVEAKDFTLSGKHEKSSLSTFSDLSLLAEAAAAHDAQQMTNGLLKEEHSPSPSSSLDDKCSTLKELLTKATSSCPSGAGDVLQRRPGSSMQSSLEEIIHKVMKLTPAVAVPKTVFFSHFLPCNRPPLSGRPHPIPKCSLEQSLNLFPGVLHSWLDDGQVLRLLSPQNSGNVQLFQQHWRHNLPVIISNCNSFIDNSIWKPETFLKEFGKFEGQLVNCATGDEIDGHRMKKFWDGFERISSRLKDKEGQPMILKLKNWPLKDEFCELLPEHSQDLLHNLPLPEYTRNSGPFNLVSRLPEFFAKPDLGPKLSCAYGQAKHCQTATSNLHIDVSDAFNLLAYVGIPKDDLDNQKSVMEALDSCGCCQLTKDRLKEPGTKPGAVWHIFDPEDADKIRELLNKVASEQGKLVELHHDPIHDQSWYLDHGLRERLCSEYGVQCCTIVQCLGDAIFVPAAAPFQVCNLNSCISVTCDFVSPENLDNCFKMTQECHHLSGESQRASHEDKLQVKNIIYHALKDAIAVLNLSLPKYDG